SSNRIGRDCRTRVIMLTWAAGEAAATAAAFNYRNGSLQGSGTDRLEPFFEPVAEHRHAHKVFRRTPPGAALAGLRDGGLPFGGVEIAADYPGDRDQFGGRVGIEVVHEGAQSGLGQVFRLFFGQAVMVVAIVRAVVQLDLVFAAGLIVVVERGTDGLRF